jgi:hypothetical protein
LVIALACGRGTAIGGRGVPAIGIVEPALGAPDHVARDLAFAAGGVIRSLVQGK